MSTQITTAFVQQYTRGIDLLVQQMGSRLRNAVRVESGINGKNAFFDQIGATAAILRTGRHTDTPLISTPHSRRRLTLQDYEWADLIDDPDKVRVLNDPTNDYSRNAAFAMGRAIDDVIIAAMGGTADTGETGGTPVPFDGTNQVVDDSAANPLTVAKLRTTKRILDQRENDPNEERFFVCSARQIENLLQETEVTSSDFATVKALVQGEVNSFMGFTFIRSERLPSQQANRRYNFAWRRSGVTLGIGKDSTGRISERPDKSYSTQVFYSMSIGSVRMEEEAVVRINNDES